MRCEIDHNDLFPEGRELREAVAARVDRAGVAVEDELIVAADGTLQYAIGTPKCVWRFPRSC